jgi:hypothetical protein
VRCLTCPGPALSRLLEAPYGFLLEGLSVFPIWCYVRIHPLRDHALAHDGGVSVSLMLCRPDDAAVDNFPAAGSIK